jgi:hypothetical protein
MWCIAEHNDEYIKAMEDVLEVYERPLSAEEPVVCVDEKPVTLHTDVRKPLPMKPGGVAKARHWIRTLGNCECIPRHRTASRRSLNEGHTEPVVAGICRLHRVDRPPLSRGADHPSGHGQPEFPHQESADGPLRRGRKWGALWDRFTVHYTPAHGSWLNQAEPEIGLFSKQCLGKRRLGKIRMLRAEARAWNRRTNRNRITINRTLDRKKARTKFKYKYKIKRS